MQDKKKLRSKLRHKRQTLDPTLRTTAHTTLQQKLVTLSVFQQSHLIAGFLPHDGEIDPTPIMQTCWQQQKKYYLPILHPAGLNRLWFVEYQPQDTLVPNRFNILEPQYNTKRLLAPWELDLVLVPLVGFDAHCHRLGMGKGFYDQTFHFLKQPFRNKPYLLGLAYELQKVDDITQESWDIVLNGVLTEKNFYQKD